jgi:hypothetical protein
VDIQMCYISDLSDATQELASALKASSRDHFSVEFLGWVVHWGRPWWIFGNLM